VTEVGNRDATVSFRTATDTEARLTAIAESQGMTLSSLLDQMALERIELERRRYLRLRAAFEADQDFCS
jgi:hypothetical protein